MPLRPQLPLLTQCDILARADNIRSFASRAAPKHTAGPYAPRPRRGRTTLIVIAGGLVVGTGLVQFTETGHFTYKAAERTGRVIGTLAKNINDYRRTLNKHDEIPQEEYTALLKACHKRCAERTLHAMEANGSIFIKLGQHLSSLNYLLPSEWCDTFIPLQDKCPISSYESIRAMVEKDTGRRFDELFSDFEREPLGAASLAQVHRATYAATGQRVAVKAQHPVLDYWAPLDMYLTSQTFKWLKRAFPEYDLTWLSKEMENSLPQELDFELEGNNARSAREYFKNNKEFPLVIPEVIWAQRRVLVMEYITGHRPDDLTFLDANNISRDEVAASLARVFNTMIFSRGAPLHCDPHGGNIAIRRNDSRRRPHNFDIVLYDHGLYRSIPLHLQRNYAKLWLAVIDADEAGMRKYARETAGISDDDFPLFASAITGRDYKVVASNVSTPRDQEEKRAISEAFGEGLLQQLVQLLGKVPSIMLLILKTNDLTRSLDSNLHTTQGPMRSFLILARYAAQTVFDEQVEALRTAGSLVWPPRHLGRLMMAWTAYARVKLKLELYEWYLYVRGAMGMTIEAPGLSSGSSGR